MDSLALSLPSSKKFKSGNCFISNMEALENSTKELGVASLHSDISNIIEEQLLVLYDLEYQRDL